MRRVMRGSRSFGLPSRRHARPFGTAAWAALFACFATTSSSAPGLRIAITLDDLPFVNAVRPGDSRMAATGRILATLAKHRVPATGFVVCDRVAGQEEILRQWVDAGMELGNHSCSHPHLDRIPLAEWEEEVRACDETLTRFTGTHPRWFRYPFLQMGATVALRDSAVAIVRRSGHEVAPVSVDTGEWALVTPYVDAWKAGNARLAREVGDAYVDHLLNAVDHYRDVSLARFGRDVPHVLLLHANALAADYLDTLLTALEGRAVTFVPLADALSDSVYGLPDGYDGRIGLSWLYRTAPYLDGAWAWDSAQVEAFAQRFGSAPDPDSCWIDGDLRVRRLRDGVWVVTQEKPVPANSLLTELADSTLLLVDAPGIPEATRSLLQWCTARFGTRPIIAVNTRCDAEAMGGNEALICAGIPIYGSDLTARLLAEHEEPVGVRIPEQSARSPNPAWPGSAHPVAPDHLFPLVEGLTLVRGDTVRVIYPGPCCSPDNVVVFLPRQRVLYAGCVVFGNNGLARIDDTDAVVWQAAVERLKPLDSEFVLPGHGGMFTPDLLEHTLDVLANAK